MLLLLPQLWVLAILNDLCSIVGSYVIFVSVA